MVRKRGTATGLLRTEWGTTMTEVDQNEAGFTFDSDEEELVTYGVGPCIAIAIVNQTRRWAGLCHYDNVHHKVPQLRAFLSEARRACGPEDTVELWIGGGDNTDQATADGVNRSREVAESVVQSLFPITSSPLWIDCGGAYDICVSAASADIMFELISSDEPTDP